MRVKYIIKIAEEENQRLKGKWPINKTLSVIK